MADYDIFREQLGTIFPKYGLYGHALWDPNPRKPDRPVRVGEVGFILVSMGKFRCLFNVLRGYEPLVACSLDHHITESPLTSGHCCSFGVGVGHASLEVTTIRNFNFSSELLLLFQPR